MMHIQRPSTEIDVILIIPAAQTPFSKQEFRSQYLRFIEEYMGVGYLCAVLRDNRIRTRIVDTRLPDFDIRGLCHTINGSNVKIVGISDIQDSHRFTMQLAASIKQQCPRVRIVLGGHYPTACYEEILKRMPEIDAVVIGEGEQTFLELVKRMLADQCFSDLPGLAYRDDNENTHPVKRTGDRPLIENLDELPFPSRDLLPIYTGYRGEGAAGIISSRGCYGSCSFCSISSFYRKVGGRLWRGRSPESVAAEIEQVAKDDNVNYFSFCDDNFLGGGQRSKERAYRLAEILEKKKPGITFSFMCRTNDVDRELFHVLKKAGLRVVFIGLEAMNARSLDFFNKKITPRENKEAIDTLLDLDIQCEPGFIMFDFSSTLEGIKENLNFLNYYLERTKHKGVHYSYLKLFSFLKIYKGTPLETRLKTHLNYDEDHVNPSYRISDPKAYFLKEIAFKTIRNRTKMIYKQFMQMEIQSGDNREKRRALYSAKAGLYGFTIDAMLKLANILEADKIAEMNEFEHYLDSGIKEIRLSLGSLQG